MKKRQREREKQRRERKVQMSKYSRQITQSTTDARGYAGSELEQRHRPEQKREGR